MNLLPRRFVINGFLVENDVITGGAGVVAQRDSLIAAIEKAPTDDGLTLVHPTFGTIKNISVIGPVEFNERRDLGRVFEFRMTLLKGGARVYPKATTSTTNAASSAATSALATAIAEFKSAVSTVLSVVSAVTTAVATAEKWITIAETAVSDVKSVFSAVTALTGSLGRYSSGSNSGYSASNRATVTTATGLSTAVSAALSDSLTARGAVTTAATELATATAGIASDTDTFTSAVSALVSAVAATATDPADALRLMESLADFSPNSYTPDSVLGTARSTMELTVAALFRRAALAQLVTSATSYQPASSGDAQTTLSTITGLLDSEILAAADGGDDATYMAFRAMRAALVADLSTRGSQLSAVKTFTVGANLPSLVVAQKIYQDPTRADELVTQADPIHPAFMPATFEALST
jgi:prophage DNA circulation protein